MNAKHVFLSIAFFLLIIVPLLIVCAVPFSRWYARRKYEQMQQQTNPFRAWRLYAYGGGSITYEARRSDAIRYCGEVFGTVSFVDDEHGFIFYKPKGWSRGEVQI